MDKLVIPTIQVISDQVRKLTRLGHDAPEPVEETVKTDYGSVVVAVQGDRTKPAILTYSDLGLHYKSNFLPFFSYPEMKFIFKHFCVYHINAPGQEENAATLPATWFHVFGLKYPSMDQLAEQIDTIIAHFGLKRVICLGVGAGANIMTRFCLSNPKIVDALCILNCVSGVASQRELNFQKTHSGSVFDKKVSPDMLDFLQWHHFGEITPENQDLAHVYRRLWEDTVNQHNLALFIESFVQRTPLPVDHRVLPPIKLPILSMIGVSSPYVDDTVNLNSQLNTVDSQWIILQDCSMVIKEQPEKLAEALRLFLQAQGHIPAVAPEKLLEGFHKLAVPAVNHEEVGLDATTATITIDPEDKSEVENGDK